MKKYTLIILAALVVIVFVALLFFIPYFERVRQLPSKADLDAASVIVDELSKQVKRTSVTGWHMPASTRQGIPFIENLSKTDPLTNVMRMYDFNTETSRPAGTRVNQGGYSMSYGDTAPLASPDFLYTAYTDSTHTLYIISNETFERRAVYQTGQSEPYITGWSADAKKLVFSLPNSQNENEPPSSPLEGMYGVFDTTDGTLIMIPAEKGVTFGEGFLDDNHLIAEVLVGQHEVATAFNLSTMRMDHAFFKEKLGFTPWMPYPGYSFSIDRTKVAYTESFMGDEVYVNTPAGLKKGGEGIIVLGDIQSGTNTVLASGPIGQYQLAIISPDGTKVAYMEQLPQAPDGNSQSTFWTYDALTQKKNRYDSVNTRQVRWLNSNKLLFVSYTFGPASTASYFVMDTKTGEVKKIP